jgi:hypothetical protein
MGRLAGGAGGVGLVYMLLVAEGAGTTLATMGRGGTGL